jgi:hypothetical protein
VHVRARRLDGGHAGRNRGPGRIIIGTDDERHAQAMAEHVVGVVGKHPLDFAKRIAAMRMQKLKSVVASG